MIAEVFHTVLIASRDAVFIAVVVVGVLLKLCGSRISPGWRYTLWLLVAIRLVIPALPSSPASWQRLLPDRSKIDLAVPAPETTISEESLYTPEVTPVIETVGFETLPAPIEKQKKQSVSIGFATSIIWMTGAGVFFSFVAISTFRIRRRISRLTERHPREAEISLLLAAVAKNAGISRPPQIRMTGGVTSPAITGIVRPEILLPPSLADELSESEIRLILLHELGHLRHNDILVNWSLSLLQGIHWFNPLVWLAFHRTRIEAEQACDSWVLQQTGSERSSEYGNILIRLLESASPSSAPPGIVGAMESREDLHRRIASIANFSRNNRWSVLAGAVLFAAIAIVGLTGPPKPEDLNEIEIEVVNSKGEPVPNSQIWMSIQKSYLSQDKEIEIGKTDANGKYTYRFFGEPGTDFGLQIFAETPNGKWGFAPGFIKNVDSLQIEAKTPASALHLKVVDTREAPVAGLKVHIAHVFQFVFPPLMPDGLWSAVTDKNGFCTIGNVPMFAHVNVAHSDPRYAQFPGFRDPVSFGHFAGNAPERARTITLHPASRLTGRVHFPNGKPVAGILVEINESSEEIQGGAWDMATSDKNGKVEFTRLLPAKYFIHVHTKGNIGKKWTSEDTEVTVRPGGAETHVDIPLVKGCLLSGKVTISDTGEAVTFPCQIGAWHPFNRRFSKFVTTDKNGRYKFMVPAGDIRMSMSPVDNLPEGLSLRHKNESISVAAGEPRTYNFSFKRTVPKFYISGVVLNRNAIPVAHASVGRLEGNKVSERIATTDQSGRFKLPVYSESESIKILAFRNSDFTALKTVIPGREVKLHFLGDHELCVFRGNISNQFGSPLHGISVNVSSKDPYLSWVIDAGQHAAVTDIDGNFEFRLLPERSYSFFAWGNGVKGETFDTPSGEAGGSVLIPDIKLKTNKPVKTATNSQTRELKKIIDAYKPFTPIKARVTSKQYRYDGKGETRATFGESEIDIIIGPAMTTPARFDFKYRKTRWIGGPSKFREEKIMYVFGDGYFATLNHSSGSTGKMRNPRRLEIRSKPRDPNAINPYETGYGAFLLNMKIFEKKSLLTLLQKRVPDVSIEISKDGEGGLTEVQFRMIEGLYVNSDSLIIDPDLGYAVVRRIFRVEPRDRSFVTLYPKTAHGYQTELEMSDFKKAGGGYVPANIRLTNSSGGKKVMVIETEYKKLETADGPTMNNLLSDIPPGYRVYDHRSRASFVTKAGEDVMKRLKKSLPK